jgi:uncharacterized protein YjbI with pentapeptide repeats
MADVAKPKAGPSAPKGDTKTVEPQSSKLDNLKALQIAVNEASSRTAALWISFLTFMAYLTMTVGAVTHENLLKKTTIKLPVFNVDLPLVGFFWIAPLFFLLVHFYLFLQLVILVRKLASFDVSLNAVARKKREEYRRRLDGFLVVQFLGGVEEVREGLTGKLLRAVAFITMVILPIVLLLQFQLTFLPYHDAWVTWIHRLVVLIDIRLAWIFWSAIRSGDGTIYFPELQFGWRRLIKGPSRVRQVREDIRRIGQAIRDAFRSSRSGFVASLSVILLSLFVFAFADEPIAKVVQIPTYFDIRGTKVSWELTPISDVILHGPIDIVKGKPRAWFSNVLVVPNNKLIDDKDADTPFPSLSLRGRNLSGAVFVSSDLRNVDFTGANLNDAVFDNAQLAGARFECAAHYDRVTKPGWPQDGCTWLQRASFARAKLQGAKFERARMHGAILIAANLQAADMSAAKLQDVMFTNAEMTGAKLRTADLSNAFLDGATMVGTDFSNSQMQGVLLGDTPVDLSLIQYVASPSSDRAAPLRIAMREGENKNVDDQKYVDDQIAKYFRYTAVSPSPRAGDSEQVSAGFDSENLNKFRKSVMASLIPAGIIARNFETTYKEAIEKKWSDIVAIEKNAPKTGAKEYRIVKPACDVKTGSLVTPSLVRSEPTMFTGPEAALAVIDVLKKPYCFGALDKELKDHLDAIEKKLRNGSDQTSSESSPDPPASQTARVR